MQEQAEGVCVLEWPKGQGVDANDIYIQMHVTVSLKIFPVKIDMMSD